MNILTIIIIIILIIIIITLSFNNIIIEYFNTSSAVSIICGTSEMNLDIACRTYNLTKTLISEHQNNYNSAKQNTLDKYDQWQFSKIIVDLKNTALNKAIIVDTYFKNRNILKLMSYILQCVIYVKVIIVLINSYNSDNKNITAAIDIYNYNATNANLNQINNLGSDINPNNYLNEALTAYNKYLRNLKEANIPNSDKLSEINENTLVEILETTINDINILYSEINNNYLIPSLQLYNDQANISKNTIFTIDNLSSIKSIVENEYNIANANNEINKSSAFNDYKAAIGIELAKFNTFFNLIDSLQSKFADYTKLLNQPGFAYDISFDDSLTSECNLYNYNGLTTEINNLRKQINTLQPIYTDAKNNSLSLPIRSNIDDFNISVERNYRDVKTSHYRKEDMLQYIINPNNNPEKYNKNDLINASNDFDNKYKISIDTNDTILKLIYQYNDTFEKKKYNEISKQLTEMNNNAVKLDIIRYDCFDDVPTVDTATTGGIGNN